MDLDSYFGDYLSDGDPEPIETKEAEQHAQQVRDTSAAKPTPPSGADEDTKQVDPTDALPAAPQNVPSKMALVVETVTHGALVESLSQPFNEFGQDQRARCLKVVGFAHTDLVDPDTNRQLIRRDPRLKKALKSMVTRSFAVGVNEASGTFCNAIILILLARNLLDENLAAMGSDPKSKRLRAKFVELSGEIQEGLRIIETKAQTFVSVLATTIREMGEAAFELETRCDAEQLSKMFEHADFAVSDEANGLDEELKTVLGKINEVVKFIKDNLTQENRFATLEAGVETARTNHAEAEEALFEMIHKRFEEETQISAKLRRLGSERADLERKKQIQEYGVDTEEREVKRIDQELKKLRATRSKIQGDTFDESKVPGLKDIPALIEQLKQGEAETERLLRATTQEAIDISTLQRNAQTPTEVEQARKPTILERIGKVFNDKFGSMVKREIEARRSALEERRQQLIQKEKELERQALDYRERSKTASDGYQTVQSSDSFVAIWDTSSRSAKNTMCTVCDRVCHMNCGANSRNGCLVMTCNRCTRCGHLESAHILGVTKHATTSQQVGINEKERLQHMARDVDEVAADVHARIQELREQWEAVPKQVLAEMKKQQAEKEAERQRLAQERAQFIDEQKRQALESAMEQNERIRQHNSALVDSIRSQTASIRADNQKIIETATDYNVKLKQKALEAFHEDKANALKALDEQIEAMETMKSKVEESRAACQRKLDEQNGRLRDMNQEEFVDEEQLKVIKQKYQKKIEDLEADEKKAKEEYDRKGAALRELIEQFGIENEQDFASFMKTFNLMNKSVQNLPTAMRHLSSTFRNAQETFSGEFFRRQLQSVGDDEKQKRLLMGMAESFQAVCEVGLRLFGDPIRGMLQFDASAVFDKLVEEEQSRRAIAASATGEISSTTYIVEEPDEVPRRHQED